MTTTPPPTPLLPARRRRHARLIAALTNLIGASAPARGGRPRPGPTRPARLPRRRSPGRQRPGAPWSARSRVSWSAAVLPTARRSYTACAACCAAPADVDLSGQVLLRRFDLEYNFRFGRQTLGWNTPRSVLPRPQTGGHGLVVFAHTQLRIVRAAGRKPPPTLGETSQARTPHPVRVRRGFRNIRAHLLCPARVHQPRGTGTGRPPGTKNRHHTPSYDVGRTVKRPETLKAPRQTWPILVDNEQAESTQHDHDRPS